MDYDIGDPATALQKFECWDLQAVPDPEGMHQPYKHHHSTGNVKPGNSLLPDQCSVLSDFRVLACYFAA